MEPPVTIAWGGIWLGVRTYRYSALQPGWWWVACRWSRRSRGSPRSLQLPQGGGRRGCVAIQLVLGFEVHVLSNRRDTRCHLCRPHGDPVGRVSAFEADRAVGEVHNRPDPLE